MGIVDARGRAATHTGNDCFAWAGGRTGENFAAQGNILADAAVVDGLTDTFLAGGQPFPELLVACLAAAEEAGGDRRGSESAALLIVRDGGGFGGGNDRWVDLRVDQHDDPVGELGKVLAYQRLYYDHPTPADLVPLDEAVATEIRSLLERIGGGPGGRFGTVYRRMSGEPPEDDPHPAVGESRPSHRTGTRLGRAPLSSGWTSPISRRGWPRRAGSIRGHRDPANQAGGLVNPAERPLWTCPSCGHQFVTANIWHSCTKHTLDEAFARSTLELVAPSIDLSSWSSAVARSRSSPRRRGS